MKTRGGDEYTSPPEVNWKGLTTKASSFMESCVMARCYLTENEQRQRENKKCEQNLTGSPVFR